MSGCGWVPLWRVFVGIRDDLAMAHLVGEALPWDVARDELLEKLDGFRYDECAHSFHAGEEAREKLSGAAVDQPFEANVDGDDYMLVPAGEFAAPKGWG